MYGLLELNWDDIKTLFLLVLLENKDLLLFMKNALVMYCYMQCNVLLCNITLQNAFVMYCYI